MMVNANHTLKSQRNIIDTQQSGARRPTLRQELNAEYTAQMMKVRAVRNSRNPKEVAMRERAEAYMADIAEQLVLLDACEMGFIKPVPVITDYVMELLSREAGQS
jgi:hypothetical protein